MFFASDSGALIPRPLESYADPAGGSIAQILADRAAAEPFNIIATVLFVLAIIHTFAAPFFARLAHRVQHEHNLRQKESGKEPTPDIWAEVLHFLGEVEVVFGMWAIVLLLVMVAFFNWETATHYFNDTVNYTEPMFVVVIMALASTKPVITFAESSLQRVANIGKGTPAAWWLTILIIGPILGSFVTEPAAMTICALLLARQFYDLEPSNRLKYATLGLLFVNISIGGTLTHFAAPPVLMVARPWNWDLAFMIGHFGWRSVLAIIISTLIYFFFFKKEFDFLAKKPAVPDFFEPENSEDPSPTESVPFLITLAHLAFMAWTVVTAHHPALFIGGFLVFLGFAKATSAYQSRIELKPPLLVGFFLGGLVIHGGLQGWWIAPVLGQLTEIPLFAASTLLTAFNDNAMITLLATLVPDLSEPLKIAVVEGAVTGGGLTVIANAPNPAGQALLNRFFHGAITPAGLLLGAALPTLITVMVFQAI